MKKDFSDNKSAVINCFLAVLISFLITVILMAVFSVLIYYLSIDRKVIPALSTFCLAAGTFCGSFFASYRRREKGYINGLIVAGVTVLIIMLLSIIFTKSGITPNSLFRLIIVTVASLLGGVIGVNKSVNKKFI